jgi:hypothetical protein
MKRDLAMGFAIPTAPRRTLVPVETAERFTKAEDAPANASADVSSEAERVSVVPQPRRPSARRPSSRQRRGEAGERIVIYIPTELATDLRVRCARERRSLSDAVTTALEKWAK